MAEEIKATDLQILRTLLSSRTREELQCIPASRSKMRPNKRIYEIHADLQINQIRVTTMMLTFYDDRNETGLRTFTRD